MIIWSRIADLMSEMIDKSIREIEREKTRSSSSRKEADHGAKKNAEQGQMVNYLFNFVYRLNWNCCFCCFSRTMKFIVSAADKFYYFLQLTIWNCWYSGNIKAWDFHIIVVFLYCLALVNCLMVSLKAYRNQTAKWELYFLLYSRIDA